MGLDAREGAVLNVTILPEGRQPVDHDHSASTSDQAVDPYRNLPGTYPGDGGPWRAFLVRPTASGR